jgi:hypothetical protein
MPRHMGDKSLYPSHRGIFHPSCSHCHACDGSRMNDLSTLRSTQPSRLPEHEHSDATRVVWTASCISSQSTCQYSYHPNTLSDGTASYSEDSSIESLREVEGGDVLLPSYISMILQNIFLSPRLSQHSVTNLVSGTPSQIRMFIKGLVVQGISWLPISLWNSHLQRIIICDL